MAKVPQHSEEPWKDLYCTSCFEADFDIKYQTTGMTTVYEILCNVCGTIKKIVENG